ncbi:calcium-binding protein [Methylobrevis pamukkalensis]|uniref:Bifunctional hemolysin/adenylate cyclase n=1 Tax=Methylobrevis pamukkalensis TaxID=1439726 RepID=A0A1E3H2M9_9HYPH|nr:calcium-binding protein [Methylobrevis pamukkalensis]ODN70577.1 Bifunctional hemolysin/adenylate cyclase precursor [Methylobrevis pamukkalensis]
MGYGGADTLLGDEGQDVLRGGDGDDALYGGAGADILVGGRGADILDGGYGGSLFDIASYEGSGSAISYNFSAPNTATGDIAEDTFIQISGIQGTRFDDTVIGDNSNQRFIGGDGDDLLRGSGGDDVLEGGEGQDTLDGGRDHDLLIGGGGGDTMIGGSGVDTASYEHSNHGIVVSFADPGRNTGDALGDTFKGVESLRGSSHDDTLILHPDFGGTMEGLAGNDVLVGSTSWDILYGGDGNDVLIGGHGRDELHGGAGKDVFVFDVAPSSPPASRVNDFKHGVDSFHLDSDVFGGLALGKLAAAAFNDGSLPLDADDRILVNSFNNYLAYDPDGSGSQQAVIIAYLTVGAASITASDFVVV